jgi:hypothetical protein
VSTEPPIEAIEAAFKEARRNGLVWRAESFELLLRLMQRLSPRDPGATRARLTEIWIEGDAVLALTAPSADLCEGNWHARRGRTPASPRSLCWLSSTRPRWPGPRPASRSVAYESDVGRNGPARLQPPGPENGTSRQACGRRNRFRRSSE